MTGVVWLAKEEVGGEGNRNSFREGRTRAKGEREGKACNALQDRNPRRDLLLREDQLGEFNLLGHGLLKLLPVCRSSIRAVFELGHAVEGEEGERGGRLVVASSSGDLQHGEERRKREP